jgi:hypothetical protein
LGFISRGQGLALLLNERKRPTRHFTRGAPYWALGRRRA